MNSLVTDGPEKAHASVKARVSANRKRAADDSLAQRRNAPIVWAVDPGETDSRALMRIAKTIALWSNSFHGPVLPVSVMAPFDVYWPVESMLPMTEELAKITRRWLAPVLGKYRLARVRRPHVIIKPTLSLRDSVESLTQLARSRGAGFIAVNTHARRGWSKLSLGSFTETLIATSTIPVLAVNPKTQVPKKISTIVFATDFSTGSRKIFRRALEWAKIFDARIVLFHRFDNPLPIGAYGGEFGLGVSPRVFEEFESRAESGLKTRVSGWAKLAKAAGIECHFEILRAQTRVEDAVLEVAKRTRADLIVMTTHRGPLGQSLFGSSARSVLLGAHCPMVVVHST